MIDFGLDIQDALEMPRFLSGRFAIGEARDTLDMEGRLPVAAIKALERRGHLVNPWGPGMRWPVTHTASGLIQRQAFWPAEPIRAVMELPWVTNKPLNCFL
jgi:gamma-glutamyltranspeptidase